MEILTPKFINLHFFPTIPFSVRGLRAKVELCGVGEWERWRFKRKLTQNALGIFRILIRIWFRKWLTTLVYGARFMALLLVTSVEIRESSWIGMKNATFAVLLVHFSEACELAPISANSLIVLAWMQISAGVTIQEIRLGWHHSDYMLCEQTKFFLQIELNTISCSFPGFSSVISEFQRNLLVHNGEDLGLDFRKTPLNASVSKFAAGLAEAWTEGCSYGCGFE